MGFQALGFYTRVGIDAGLVVEAVPFLTSEQEHQLQHPVILYVHVVCLDFLIDQMNRVWKIIKCC
ncbi:hypothetical protein HanRHA438_Chr15g0693581 [Helianthus annuus]|nr:hypothetical protein HanRHA438_Chr15g0693581 [Helianthus annuus]